MSTHAHISFGQLLAWEALFVILGTPLIAYLWETLNQLLALHADVARLGISVPVLLVLLGLLSLLSRRIQYWNQQDLG